MEPFAARKVKKTGESKNADIFTRLIDSETTDCNEFHLLQENLHKIVQMSDLPLCFVNRLMNAIAASKTVHFSKLQLLKT
jgi:predicted methyltransferase